MKYKKEDMYKEGWESYPDWWVDLENMFYLVYFGVGAYALHKLQYKGAPVVSFFYIACIIVVIGIQLRKHLCTHCYYFNKGRCHCAWGIIAERMFKEGDCQCDAGPKLAGVAWALVAIIPIAGMLLSFALYGLDSQLLNVLIVFIVLVITSFLVHVKSCEHCKMRFVCEGSGAKKKK